MSQEFTEEISLSDLLNDCDAVVVAVSAPVPFRVENVPIEGKSLEGEAIVPFARVWHAFDVLEVLYGTGIAKGMHIEAVQEDDAFKFELHLKYYRDGESKSPIYTRYLADPEAEIDWQAHAPVLVFLKRTRDGWEMGGYEALKERDRVITLLSEKSGPNAIPKIRRE